MVDQNATEVEIDKYLSTEGVTAEQLRAARASANAAEGPWQYSLHRTRTEEANLLTLMSLGLALVLYGICRSLGWIIEGFVGRR
ncbi:MAG: hypothetical protein KGP27_12405 [Hyphomicrobiales bacterium]|nr:hypothetical protein [Hyphomicrobiales bacterium]